jgi:hypothetical protein
MSDLNFGNSYSKFPLLPHKPLDSSAPELFQSFNLTQIIDIPTRLTNTTTSLIDLCFVSSVDDISSHGTLPKVADHDGIFVSFKNNIPLPKPIKRTMHDYKNMDQIALVNFIKDIDFENAVFTKPLDQQADAINDILTNAFAQFVESKEIVMRPDTPPWTNAYTRLLLRKKNRNYLIFKRAKCLYTASQSNPDIHPDILTRLLNRKDKLHLKSNSASKAYNYANKRIKSNFYSALNSTLNNSNISAKKKFSILTKLMNNSKISQIPPLLENGNTIDDPKTKSDLLNNFFASKAEVDNPDDEPPDIDKRPVNSPLHTIFTSYIEVAQLIRTIKKSNSSHCGVPARFLSLIATPISFPLTKLFNGMFAEGIFPDSYKIAHITAIWKRTGSKAAKSQYRPISLLPTLSKVCESIIHDRLLSHFTENSIISDRQAAYLKGDSTTNQLLYLIQSIHTAWSKGNIAHGLYLDVQGAFDKVWHNGMIAKLNSVGVENECLELFK